MTGEFVTYIADKRDGTTEWWHAVRTSDGREVRLDFDTPSADRDRNAGARSRRRGRRADARRQRWRSSRPTQIAAEGEPAPTTYAATSPDSYALVLVDLGSGVNLTAAQAHAYLASPTPTDKSFAAYYNEVSYGKYQVTGTVIGPYPFSMTTCDTTGMYKAIEPMITGTYNHLIYYFNADQPLRLRRARRRGLGVEAGQADLDERLAQLRRPDAGAGAQPRPHARQHHEVRHQQLLHHAGRRCTITEYGSSMSTMGGGCKQFNAYERWYMNWLTGCNGVKTPANGTFNLLPLETNCSGGTGIQVLQVPFPATLTVSDPQSTSTAVNLNNYYVELRTAGGIFDAYATRGPDLGRRLHRPDGLHLRQRQRARCRRRARAAAPSASRTASGPSCST